MSLQGALAKDTIQVTELSAEGHVPQLRVKNSGGAPVLVLDGEELIGAKQNRIVNVAILVVPQSELVISVSCVEAGDDKQGPADRDIRTVIPEPRAHTIRPTNCWGHWAAPPNYATVWPLVASAVWRDDV